MKKRTRVHQPSESNDEETPVRQRAFKFLSKAQEEAWEVIENNTVTFLIGESGAGKTHLATAWANKAVTEGRYKHIILTRTVAESDVSCGALPGELDMKFAPLLAPAQVCLAKTKRAIVEPKIIPMGFLRGHTFSDAVALLEESQNCDRRQLLLYLSRLGTDAKIIITGDTKQSDIKNSGLSDVIGRLQGIAGIGVYTFGPGDSVRHPLVTKILRALED